jgi:hypothetical protein
MPVSHFIDFGSRNVGNFGKYKESHTSYHESGRHPSRITGKASVTASKSGSIPQAAQL